VISSILFGTASEPTWGPFMLRDITPSIAAKGDLDHCSVSGFDVKHAYSCTYSPHCLNVIVLD
jgi:hypothetical protein